MNDMDNDELAKLYQEIRTLHAQRSDITARINVLTTRAREIEDAMAGKEYKVNWEDGSID